MSSEVCENAGLIRRWVQAVFPGAVVLDRLGPDGFGSVDIDDRFSLCRNPPCDEDGTPWWSLCTMHHVKPPRSPASVERDVIGCFANAADAVGRLVVVMATVRFEMASGKVGQS